MALTDYAYSIVDDFVINHRVDITILQTEIKLSTIIVTELHHIDANLDEDLCEVWFNDELSEAEEEELNNIIAAHTGYLPGGVDPGDVDNDGGPSDIMFSYSEGEGNNYYIKFKNKSYDIGNQFIFRGTNSLGIPKGIKAIIKGKGKLRLYDRTNSRTIFEWTDWDVNDWTIFSQASNLVWPANESIFEVQGEKDSSYAYITCFMICFSATVIDNIP